MALPTTMMAAVMPKAHEIEMQTVPVPTLAPKDVLLRVHACGICGTDLHILHGESRGTIFPIIAGHELAGEVVAVGAQAGDVPLGARVVAEGRAGTGFSRDGAYAEYVSVPKEMLHYLPPHVEMVEAALIDPLACAVNVVNQADLASTDRAAVIGQGSSGLCMLQAARVMVGCELAAIDHHDENLALSRQFGAALTVNPKTADAVAAIMDWTQNDGLDGVMEATGRESAVNLALKLVRRGGRIVIYGVFGQPVTLDLDTLMYRQLQMGGACGSPGTYPKAVELLSEGKVDLRSIVGRIMPLSQLPEAIELLEQRQVFKVVIVPDSLL
jgi:2-desacetyl-2-hydroxyethyl bacteriochlorophyllide A dehydrogenase